MYEWDGSSWSQLGSDIDGVEANDYSGYSVSLSSNGTILAVGAYIHDSYKGTTRVYEWDGSSWSQIGSDIDGEADDEYSGRSVSLNSNGTIVVIGAFGKNNNTGAARVYTYTTTTTISPICFAKGTIISTDQGNVEIQNIIPGKHTICKKAICHITKTISPEKKIVCVKKNAFGNNKPNKAITMSGNHCIQPKKGSLVKAKDLVLSNPKMKFVDYNQEPLYNVLMEDHNVIKVQNLEVETLDPENIVAKIHNSLMDKSILAKLVKQMNEGIQENNREKYLIAEYEIKKIN